MASGDDRTNLGPWRDANLRVTARAAAGIGADAELPNEVRFRSSVAKLVRRRIAVRGDVDDPLLPSVFLLLPTPPDVALPLGPKRVPMLDNGLHELAGRIWFVGANPGSGHFIMSGADDVDDLFGMVSGQLGLADVPAIVHDPRHPEPHVRFYPAGLAQLDVFNDLPVARAIVTIDAVTAAIDLTHEEKMITPSAQPAPFALWYRSSKWQPFKDAESRIQAYLEVALNTAFPTCTIRSEQTMPEGRLDIEIVENDPLDRSRITQHGILELKVLRSFGQGGAAVTPTYTRGWIKSSIEQAHAYRKRKGAGWAALVCFDMRSVDVGPKASFHGMVALAKRLDVNLRRWFLYNSSKGLQAALAKAA